MTAGPPDHDCDYQDDWRQEPFDRLQLHFVDIVNLLEVGRQLANTPGHRFAYT